MTAASFTEATAVPDIAVSLDRIANVMESYFPTLEGLLSNIDISLASLAKLDWQRTHEEVTPTYAKRKDKAILMRGRLEVVRILTDESPFLGFSTARLNPILKEPKPGVNIAQENQWRRFLKWHVIPNRPDDGSGVVIDEMGKRNPDGPEACYRRDSKHCAEEAFSREQQGMPWSWEYYRSKPEECDFCKRMKDKERAREAARREREGIAP